MSQPCRLQYRGFHQLELVRHGGERLLIGGRRRTLQEPPPNVASRPPVDAAQYVYAAWDEHRERVKLIASPTGHEACGEEEAMRGDPSTLLVGMGRPYESRPKHYHWADAPAHRKFILSYHNRKPIEWSQRLLRDEMIPPKGWSETSSGGSVSFLVWGEEAVHLEVEGRVECEAKSDPLLLGMGLDGAPPDASGVLEIAPRPSKTREQTFSLKVERRFPREEEGFHTLSLYGKTETGFWIVKRATELRFSTLG